MPLTTQLQQSNSSARAIDPGPQANTLGSLVSGLSGLTDSFRRGSETVRARESQQLQEKLSIRSDTRSQETHDTNQSEIQRGEQFRGIQSDYLEARDNLRLRREQGDLSSSSYELQLRTLIENTNSTNPGFRGEILSLTSELGDDQVAFTLSAIEEEQAEQDVASVGRLQALMDGEIANRGLGDLPRETAESLVAEQQSAEVAANASLLAMRVTSAGRELQAGERTAETSRLQGQAVASLNRRTSSQLNTLISANLAAVAAVDVTNPDEVAAGRDAIAAVDMRIAQARLALLQDTAGIPSAQRDETIAFFDNIAEQHSEQQETFGATRVRMLSDMQETFELDVTEATQVLSYLRDTFSPEEMMSEGFFGASGIPQRYIDRARAEALGASDPAAQQASRLNTIRPHIAAGFISPADLDGEDAVRYTRESRRDLSFGAENILGGEGGVVNESSARTFEDGVVGVVATVDALASGSTSERISGVLGASLANDQTLAAIHALNGDTAQRDRTGLMTSTYRRGVESLLDIERQRIQPSQFQFYNVTVNEEGVAVLNRNTVGAFSPAQSQVVAADQRRAQEFAGKYNSLVHALVDTDQYSEAQAFREATPETRQAFWASQGRSNLRDEEGEVLSPRQEQRARRVERESAAALRMQSLADIQQAAENPPTASEPAAAPAEAPVPAEAPAPAEAVAAPDPAFSRAIEHEGGSQSTGYIPTEGSGVTIAAGLDLGQWTEASLRDLGISEETVAVLSPYMGFTTRSQVEEAQLRPQDLQLTPAQETEINEAVLGNSRDRAQTTPIWDNLEEEGQAQLVSLRHWAGQLLEPNNSKLQGPSGTNELIGILDNPEATEAEMLSALQRILSVTTEGTAAYNRIERIIEEMQ